MNDKSNLQNFLTFISRKQHTRIKKQLNRKVTVSNQCAIYTFYFMRQEYVPN